MLKLKFKENHEVIVLDNGVRMLTDDTTVMCIVDPRTHTVYLPMNGFTDTDTAAIASFLCKNGIYVDRTNFGNFMRENTSFGYGLTNDHIIPKGEDQLMHKFSHIATAIADFSI